MKQEGLGLFRVITMRIPGVIFLLVLSISTYAQNQPKIDSLKRLLENQIGTERWNALFELGYEYIDVNNQIGLMYGEQAFKIAKENGDSLKIVNAGILKASALRRMGKLDSAILTYSEIIYIAKRNNFIKELNFILNGAVLSYNLTSQYDKALSLGVKVLSESEFSALL